MGQAALYSDSACANRAVTFTVPAQSSGFIIYLADSLIENIDPIFSVGTLPFNASIAVVSKLATKFVLQVPSSMTSYACTAVNIATENASSLVVPATVNAAVTFPSGYVFSDPSCLSKISSLTFKNASTNKFYVRQILIGSYNLVVNDPSHAIVSATATIALLPAAPAQIVATRVATFYLNICGAFTLNTEDVSGNESIDNVNINLNILNLSVSSTNVGAFYSDASCTKVATQVHLTASQNDLTVYYKPAALTNLSLGFSDAANHLIAGNIAQTITAKP